MNIRLLLKAFLFFILLTIIFSIFAIVFSSGGDPNIVYTFANISLVKNEFSKFLINGNRVLRSISDGTGFANLFGNDLVGVQNNSNAVVIHNSSEIEINNYSLVANVSEIQNTTIIINVSEIEDDVFNESDYDIIVSNGTNVRLVITFKNAIVASNIVENILC